MVSLGLWSIPLASDKKAELFNGFNGYNGLRYNIIDIYD